MNSESTLFTNKFLSSSKQKDVPLLQQQEFNKWYQKVEHNKKTLVKPDNKDTVLKKTVVCIDSAFRDKNFFPQQNHFITYLGKTFYNVKEVKLVSTEIPNTDQVIRESPPELQNNTMYWVNTEDLSLNYYINVPISENVPGYLDITIASHGLLSDSEIVIYNSYLSTDTSITHILDGSYLATIVDDDTIRVIYEEGLPVIAFGNVNLYLPVYKIECKPGNYTASTLAEQLQDSFNQVKRRNLQGQYHYYEVSVNLDTDVMSFDSVITRRLGSNPLSTTSGSEIITVNSIAHGLKTGDRIKLLNVRSTAGIPAGILNGDFVVNVVDFNTFTYEVNTRAIETTDGGGNTVMTGQDAPYRFLLRSKSTLIQYNTGFADEDSGTYVNTSDPITTRIISIVDAQRNGDYITLTADGPHGLTQATKIIIDAITNEGSSIHVLTTTDHGLELPQRITLRKTNTNPNIDGVYNIVPTGKRTFLIKNRNVISSGNYGEILYGGDKVIINNLKTVPKISNKTDFFVENSLFFPNIFEIYFFTTDIDTIQASDNCFCGTNQVSIYHPDHGFNKIASITSYNTSFCKIKTFLPHTKVGSFYAATQVVDGPVNTNTVDFTIINHGLTTSDQITVVNSTTDPVIDGVYIIQVISTDIIRINFVHSMFVDGTADVITGDKVTINKSNSSPRIDGYYPIINRFNITSVSTGTLTVTVTISGPTPIDVGDKLVITANSIPPLAGEYIVNTIINSTQFTIIVEEPITSAATSGIVINQISSLIKTDFDIVTPGTRGTFNVRKNIASHYRVESEDLNGNTIGGIELNYINGVPYEIDIVDKDNYLIRLNGGYSTKNFTGGGNNVTISSEIDGNRSIQSNTDTGEPSGKLFRSISLEGQNYIFMQIPELNNVLTNGSVGNVFAKLILEESPGLMVFNGFVSAPKVFNEPVAQLDTLTITIIDKNGFPFNFTDINYSFSLEITEVVESLKNTGLSSLRVN